MNISRSETEPSALHLQSISKRFGPIVVLRDVSIAFKRGEIHALIGGNGAGKSTVGKIAGGFYSKTSGQIFVGGERVDHWTPAHALEKGVAIMHQELQVVPSLTVAQNVFLGIENARLGLLKGDEESRLSTLAARCGFHLVANAKAGDLGVADQQKIEIMRALARNARVLVMDEPTSSLTEDEAQKLHIIMRQLRNDGATVIYVSHFLDHILTTCDRVTIMKDGAVVRTSDIAHETKASLISGILGEGEESIHFPPLPKVEAAELAIDVRNLSTSTGLRNVTFHIRKGEIVGLVGLVGSGRTKIARTIYGLENASSGAVILSGNNYPRRSPRTSIKRKLVMVPEDRRGQGLFLSQDLTFNTTLPYLEKFLCAGVLRTESEGRTTEGNIRRFAVSPARRKATIANLSGGNQQKILLGRWLLDDPDVVILDDPSRGVDVGARQRIHDLIVELAQSGKAILLISSEIEEVLQMSHRAYLVKSGSIAGEIDPRSESVSSVLHALYAPDSELETH